MRKGMRFGRCRGGLGRGSGRALSAPGKGRKSVLLGGTRMGAPANLNGSL